MWATRSGAWGLVGLMGLVALLGVAGCGGGSAEPDVQPLPMRLAWSTPTSTGHQPRGDFEATRLTDGAVLVVQRQVVAAGTAGDTDEVVEAVLRQADGRELQRRELARVRGLRCCAAPASGVRLAADGRGGAYMAWTERLEAAPYRRVWVQHVSSAAGFGPVWPLATSPARAVVAFELAVDFGGVATLLWAESVPDAPVTRELGATTLRLGRAERAGPVDTPVAIGPVVPVNEAAAWRLALAVSPDGARAVAWAHSGTGEFKRLWAVAAPAGSALGSPSQVLDPGLMSERLATLQSLALDVIGGGQAALAWAVQTVSPDRQVVGLALGSASGFVVSPWRAEPARSVAWVQVAGLDRALVQYTDPTQTTTQQPHLRLARLAAGAAVPEWQAELTPAATQPYFVSSPVAAKLPDGWTAFSWSEVARVTGLPAPDTLRRRSTWNGLELGAAETLGPVLGGSGAPRWAGDGADRQTLFWLSADGSLWSTTATMVPR